MARLVGANSIFPRGVWVWAPGNPVEFVTGSYYGGGALALAGGLLLVVVAGGGWTRFKAAVFDWLGNR